MDSEITAERERLIAKAAGRDITLNPEDFRIIDGGLYLDGMDPDEWIDAVAG